MVAMIAGTCQMRRVADALLDSLLVEMDPAYSSLKSVMES